MKGSQERSTGGEGERGSPKKGEAEEPMRSPK